MTTRARYDGKTVVVTGASGWIGGAIARRFSAEGVNVVVTAQRRDRLDALVDELGPERALTVTADVTRREGLDALMRAAADRFGGIDDLVSNAGNAFPRAFEELTSDEWRHFMATNADSAFLGAQAAPPHLKRSHGSIVDIAALWEPKWYMPTTFG
ncbi:SDR family NAD(P)-dependent oxidoreductase [Streptomyces sp. NPDC006743]|uniref:SDR family oxidoreductase n=1 Tax=Streptomyces sp. NPDC006743 TaxID=3154480 RepID=UPI0034550867